MKTYQARVARTMIRGRLAYRIDDVLAGAQAIAKVAAR